MPNLAEIREQYPQYKDMDDKSLADALYKKYYSDWPRQKFDMEIGYTPVGTPAPQPAPVPEKTFMGNRPGLDMGDVRDVVNKTVDVVTGRQSPSRDLPEFTAIGGFKNLPLGKQFAIGAAMSLVPDEKAKADIVIKNIPGAQVRDDGTGNLVIDISPEVSKQTGLQAGSFNLNKPGLSEQDLYSGAGQVASFLPAAGVAGLGGNPLSRIALGGGAAGVTSLLQDAGATALGSEQRVDWSRAGVATVAGGAAELLGPALQKIAQAWSRGRSVYINKAGDLTDAGRRLFETFGIDPNKVSRGVINQVDDIARQAGGDFGKSAKAATEAVATAEGKNFGIDYTAGQRSGNVRQIAKEEAMRNVGRGERAATTMKNFDQKQEQQIRDAAAKLQARLSSSGQPTVSSEFDVGADILARVREAEQQASASISRAYEAVSDVDAKTSVKSISGLARSMVEGLKKRTVFAETPATLQALAEVRKLQRLGKANVTKVTLKLIETTRRRLGALADAGKNPADTGNVLAMKRGLDRWLDDAYDNAMFSGDQAALDMLKTARSERATYGRLFESSKLQPDQEAGRLVQKMIDRDVTNQGAVDMIFGRSAIGDKDVSLSILNRLEQVLGPGSSEWGALREAAFRRVLFGPKVKGNEVLSKQRMVTQLNEALRGRGRQVMEKLFTKEELAEFEAFARAVDRTITPAEAMNPSKTGYEIARLLQDMFPKLAAAAGMAMEGGVTGGVVGGLAAKGLTTGTKAATDAAATRTALSPLRLPPPRNIPLFAAITAGGTAAGQSVFDGER